MSWNERNGDLIEQTDDEDTSEYYAAVEPAWEDELEFVRMQELADTMEDYAMTSAQIESRYGPSLSHTEMGEVR